MTNPLTTIPADVRAALADEIIKRYTPFAFTCDCKGTDPECKRIIESDRYAIGQAHTAARIAAFITGKPDRW